MGNLAFEANIFPTKILQGAAQVVRVDKSINFNRFRPDAIRFAAAGHAEFLCALDGISDRRMTAADYQIRNVGINGALVVRRKVNRG